MRSGKVRDPLLLILAALVIGGLVLLYGVRSNHCVLYYYGASPGEVPQGSAIAILNPLRNRKDEKNAKRLIRDLRTNRCEEISRERLGADPAQICPIMRGNSRASLIWLGPDKNTTSGGTRELVYELPDRKARLIVYFGADESGWGIKTVAVVR